MAGAPPSSEVVMTCIPGTVKPRAFLFAALLFAAVASPLAAQQATIPAPVPAPAGQAAATPASVPTTPLPGPRERAEMRPVEPSFSTSSAAPSARFQSHTITVSTVVLVLLVVILVLLIAH
jgi:hypothetical protein